MVAALNSILYHFRLVPLQFLVAAGAILIDRLLQRLSSRNFRAYWPLAHFFTAEK